MNNKLFVIIIFFTSCFPNMHEGEFPHSIDFKFDKFESIRKELLASCNNKSSISEDVLIKMKEIGFLKHICFDDKYQIFLCGNGILDQESWGFIYGKIDTVSNKTPYLIRNNITSIEITYIKHIQNNWYEFSGNIY